MKLDIRNIRRIEDLLKSDKNIQTKEYEKKCYISSRNWFIKEFSLPLSNDIIDLIKQSDKMDIHLEKDSVISYFQLRNNYFENSQFGDIELIMLYETNVNHTEKTIDYENKRYITKYFFCNDTCCKVGTTKQNKEG